MSFRLSEEERRRRRQDLRAAGRSLMDESVDSPCVSICRIEGEVCIGCRRSISEIVDWALLTAAEKHAVLEALDARGAPQAAACR